MCSLTDMKIMSVLVLTLFAATMAADLMDIHSLGYKDTLRYGK